MEYPLISCPYGSSHHTDLLQRRFPCEIPKGPPTTYLDVPGSEVRARRPVDVLEELLGEVCDEVDVDLLRGLADHAVEDGGHVGVVLLGVEEVVHQLVVARHLPPLRVVQVDLVLDQGVPVPVVRYWVFFSILLSLNFWCEINLSQGNNVT